MKNKTSLYIVAFLDVLGAKNKIKQGDIKFFEELDSLYETTKEKMLNNKYTSRGIKYKIFSDNIFFYKRISSKMINAYNIASFLLFISQYIQIALSYKILIRGGVTIGEMYNHNTQTFIIGKALARAYELESKIAIFPRVILDVDVRGYLSTLPECDLFNFDTDDNFFWYMHPCKVIFQDKKYRIKHEVMKNRLIDACKFEKNTSIVQKHLWLINKFNETCINNNKANCLINIFQDYASLEQLQTIQI